MSATLASVRDAIAVALRTVSGLNADGYLVQKIRSPHAMVDLEIDYDQTLGRGSDEYLFTITVYAQRDNDGQSQKYLDQLRDGRQATSLKRVLEGDAGVLATVDYIRVRKVSGVHVALSGAPNVEYLAVVFEVEAMIQ